MHQRTVKHLNGSDAWSTTNGMACYQTGMFSSTIMHARTLLQALFGNFNSGVYKHQAYSPNLAPSDFTCSLKITIFWVAVILQVLRKRKKQSLIGWKNWQWTSAMKTFKILCHTKISAKSQWWLCRKIKQGLVASTQ